MPKEQGTAITCPMFGRPRLDRDLLPAPDVLQVRCAARFFRRRRPDCDARRCAQSFGPSSRQSDFFLCAPLTGGGMLGASLSNYASLAFSNQGIERLSTGCKKRVGRLAPCGSHLYDVCVCALVRAVRCRQTSARVSNVVASLAQCRLTSATYRRRNSK